MVHREVTLSVVIPVYNVEAVVEKLHAAVTGVLDSLGESWEIIYVNDGSDDGSQERLLQFQELDARVTVLELSRNWGHQPALTAGLRHARGQAVVLMDGDLQDPPTAIPKFLKAWREGAEVVVAQRRTRDEHGFRTWAYPLFYRLLGLISDYPIPLNAGIFGLLDRRVVDAINSLSESNRYLPGLRAWVGFRTAVVYYDRAERAAGRPKQTFWRLLQYAFDAIFSFSYKPLRLSLALGTLITLFAVFYSLFVVFMRLANWQLRGPLASGDTGTLVGILFLGGVQLICIGLLGEYIGRIYDEVKARPLYLVKQVYRSEVKVRAAAVEPHAITDVDSPLAA